MIGWSFFYFYLFGVFWDVTTLVEKKEKCLEYMAVFGILLEFL